MASFLFPLRIPAAVTAPTNVFPATLPSAEDERFFDGLPLSIVELPSHRGLVMANGVDPMRILTRDEIYDLGLLPPKAAPTLAAGARASTRLDTDNGGAYVIADGDAVLIVGLPAGYGATDSEYTMTFRTALSGASNEVKINGSTANALINLKKYVNQDGLAGVDYSSNFAKIPLYVEATTITATDLTLRALTDGAGGNSYECVWTGGVGPRFEVEGSNTNQVLFSGGADASGTSPEVGEHTYAYQSVRTADNALSARSPKASVQTTTASNVALTALVANNDATSDFTRVLRSTVGGEDLYREQDISSAGTMATSSLSDQRLQDFGIPIYNDAEFRTYREGLPPKLRHVTTWKGRVAGIGAVLAADYTFGTAAVVVTTDGADNDTVTITGTGVRLDANMVGRLFQVASTAETYRILKCVPSTGVITLDRGYEGVTNATASYTIRDDRDPCQLYLSEPNKPNQWPSINNPGGVETDDAEGGTGIFATERSLFCFSRTSITEVVGDDFQTWQMRTVVDGCGCVSGQTIQGTPLGVVWLGRDAVYLWNLSGKPIPVSTSSSKRPRGIDRTFDRISWAHIHQAIAAPYDEVTRTVRFFVPMDGAEVPTHAIVFDIANLGVWVLDLASEITAACNAVAPDGTTAVLLGDSLGCVKHDGLATTVDQAFGFVSIQTLSGAQTVRALAVAGTPLPTTGILTGCPVTVVYANGTTARRKIASVTSSTITLSRDLDTAPAAADQVAIGHIDSDMETGRFRLSDGWGASGLRDVVTLHVVEAASAATDTTKEYHLAYAANQATEAIPTRGFTRGDVTVSTGRRRFRTQSRANLHKLRWRCFDPEAQFALLGFLTLSAGAAPDPE